MIATSVPVCEPRSSGGRVASVACVALAAGLASAQIQSIDLALYRHVATYSLPSSASEASAVAFRPETGTLLVLGDEGDAIVEVSRAGVLLSTMTLVGFEDTEGLTYAGGQFLLAEERLQDVYRLTYIPGGSVQRSALATVSLGATIGNEGIEGISSDPRDGSLVYVKEKTPMAVRRAVVNFSTGAASLTDLFTPSLGVTDLADVQVLSAVPSLGGSPDADHLLLLSQETSRLLEVTRQGVVLSQFSLLGLSTNAEGVTIDDAGVIYVCDETPRLFVLEPPCRADLTTTAAPGSTGYGVANWVLNSEDFFYYLAQYGLGNLTVADLTASATPGLPGYGFPNGLLNSEDFFYYLAIYAGGC